MEAATLERPSSLRWVDSKFTHPRHSHKSRCWTRKSVAVDRNTTVDSDYRDDPSLEPVYKARASSPGSRTHSEAKKRHRQELLWLEFFEDPAQWWDNRRDKKNPQDPDFRHKSKNGALTIRSRFAPSWVESKLAELDDVAPSPSVSGEQHASRSGGAPSSETCAW